MNEVIDKIETLQEDKPELVITDDLIKQFVQDNLDWIVKETQDELVGKNIEEKWRRINE